MTTVPEPERRGADEREPREATPPDNAPLNNGLTAPRYVPLTDVDPSAATHLLTALGKARIAAYLDTSPAAGSAKRLFVDADERSDARTIVAAVLRATGRPYPPPPANERPGGGRQAAFADENIDYDAAFADLIADWHVDTVTAIREAERALSREDADWRARLEQPAAERAEPSEPAVPSVPTMPTWLDEQHYVPPAPPPLPRFAARTIAALVLLVASVLLLGLSGAFGIANKLTMLIGVCGVLIGASMLVMRLRVRHDDDDDGAVV